MKTIRLLVVTVISIMLAVCPTQAAATKSLTTEKMGALANRVAQGSPTAFKELRDIADELYGNIDSNREKGRLASNNALMRAAFDPLGEQAGKGNRKAFEALKASLAYKHMNGMAAGALGHAAAAGHAEALDMLLNSEKWGILKSTALYALGGAAEQNNAKVVDYLIAVLDNSPDRSLCFAATKSLTAAANRGNAKARAALDRNPSRTATPNSIGIMADKTDAQGLHVTAVLSGSPASRAGLRSGDVIVEVNTKSLKGLQHRQALSLVCGMPGYDVDLRIERPGSNEPLALKVEQGSRPTRP
jgi:hypothetical protein